jgi:hypothetical protein
VLFGLLGFARFRKNRATNGKMSLIATLLPGKAATFAGVPVDQAPGELQIEVTPGFASEWVYFTGQA